jgi:iron complex outermembrane recepter protein
MKKPTLPWRLWPLHVFSLLVALVATVPLQAQPAGTGVVRGTVYNPVAKEYVRNAEVRLEGTSRVAFTENDGSFQFTGVAPGQASVTVAYTGYTATKETFTVSAGETSVREINLTSTATANEATTKDGVLKMDAYTVQTQREGNAKAIMAQRRDMNIITSVSSDIFGEVTDGNVGEFLKYLPGVDLDYVESEPRGPRLGGMDGQYVGVAFDGVRSASADANRGGGSSSRATSFEGFAITSVDSVEINRTASPENDADSPAGTVNMKTKRAFDRKGRTFTYSYGINMNGEEFTLKKVPGIEDGANKYKDYKWSPNWQMSYAESFFNKKFGVLLSASHSNQYTEQTAITMDYARGAATDARPMVLRDINFGDGPKFIIKDALLLTADWRVTPRLTLSTNLIYSYFEGHFQNRNFDFLAANNNTNVDNGRETVGGDGVLTVIGMRNLSAATGQAGAINGVVQNNGVSRLDNGGGGAAKMAYNRQFVPKFEYKIGSWVMDGYMAFSKAKNNYDAIERGFSNNEGGGVPSSWIATRPNAQSWEWTIRQTTGSDWYDMRSFVNTNTRDGGTRINNDDRTWVTEKWTGVLNARWTVPFLQRFPTVVKFGGKWDEETRINRTDTPLNVWSYNGPGGNTTTVNANTGANVITTWGNWANVGPDYISKFPFDTGTTNALTVININGQQGMPPRASRFEMANLFHAHPELWVNTSTPEDYYTANYVNSRHFRETITGGYAQADMRITSKLQIRFGGRVEETKDALREFDPLTRNELLARGVALNPVATNAGRPLTIAGMRTMFETNPMVTRHSKYTDFFPSLVAKYQILPDLEWQAGVNKGISRPPIDNLTGLWVLNDNVTPPTVNAPNPTLKPEHHKVYQTRIAYYFGGRSPGQVSVAYIQDEATNFIVNNDYTAEQFGVTDPDFANYIFKSTVNTVALQRYKNLDLSYNQTLGFLPSEYLRGISVGATYSRSYANQRRQGLAPHRATARLGYAYKRFSGSIGAIWVDNRPNSSVVGRYWGAMTKLDVNLNFRLTKYATLYVQARNPTNQKDQYYESPPGFEEGKHGLLRSTEEYGDNWVFGLKGQF